ncbi:MAG: hypothetical protein ACLR0F_19630 [Eisenbergiella sp.]
MEADRKKLTDGAAEVCLTVRENGVVYFEVSAVKAGGDRGYCYKRVIGKQAVCRKRRYTAKRRHVSRGRVYGQNNSSYRKEKISDRPNLYGIFFEDINRAGDGGLYPELLRNRSFEESIEPKDCRTGQDGYALVSRAGWRDEFNHGEGLSRWVRKNGTPYTPIPAWYTNHAQMALDRNDTLNPHRQVSLAASLKRRRAV